MRAILCSTLLATLAVSCQIPYTAYRGSGEIPGQVGSVRTVNGVDLWENGKPARGCQVVGVLQDDGESDSALANAARKQGGDVLIHGGVDHYGNVDLRMRSRWLVAKYVQ